MSTADLQHEPTSPATANGDELFDRPAPPEYLAEWGERLAAPPDVAEEVARSVVIFRLGDEWLAIRTGILVEVTHIHAIHSIPHRTGEVLLGLVNVRGQLRIAISLHGLLRVESDHPAAHGAKSTSATTASNEDLGHGRMILLQDHLHQWVFVAEEVVGVYRIRTGQFQKVPSTFGKTASYCQSVFAWRDHTVGLVDDERLVHSLRSLCQ
jgi:chemotaxis-related protein WspD